MSKKSKKYKKRIAELEKAIKKIRDYNYVQPREYFYITDICEDAIGSGTKEQWDAGILANAHRMRTEEVGGVFYDGQME